ncbi:MAG TPA: RdgB/HAM1 family non-canonical purine NTP pyrophosphatase [Anaerolineaceae bacterium]|jgi:XTP/dITP diphosphohydrolase|nr:RdgB/HAM1 family non-canonical purine NTP pyrophosphatase [Anaerolineaceae bacterium]
MININNNKSMQLLLATTNKGKIRELSSLLAGLPLQLLTPQEVSPDTRVEETGRTYLENALLKAFAYQAATGLAVLADDTGLEVDALDGAPGLHSARFSPLPGATDADRRALLLAHLAGKPRPWLARFQCVVVVLLPGAEPQVSYGSVEGEIIGEERGEQGFGYDRLFWIPAAGKTMAELGLEGKNRFSHRAAAVKNAIPYLRSVIK